MSDHDTTTLAPDRMEIVNAHLATLTTTEAIDAFATDLDDRVRALGLACGDRPFASNDKTHRLTVLRSAIGDVVRACGVRGSP